MEAEAHFGGGVRPLVHLGLVGEHDASIVRRIVEKMGGTVGVESDGVGSGSTFSFTLPQAR